MMVHPVTTTPDRSEMAIMVSIARITVHTMRAVATKAIVVDTHPIMVAMTTISEEAATNHPSKRRKTKTTTTTRIDSQDHID